MMLVAARLAYPLCVTLLEALHVLGRRPGDRSVDHAVRAVYAWLDRRFRRQREHDEVRQITLVKVARAATTFAGTTVAEAESWVSRVYQRTGIDLGRKRTASPLDGKRSTGTDAFDPLDLVAAEPPSEAPGEDTEAALEELLDVLLDRVDEFIQTAATRPAQRAKMRRQAEVAILRKVWRLSGPEILALLVDCPSEATLYKWIERGRDKVLLPTLEAWDEPGISGATRRFVEEIRALLVAGRRADHGVSRPKGRTSVQYADAETPVPGVDQDEATHD
jgi:DNA-directed RNA polymerase specialized sigma24 family protein